MASRRSKNAERAISLPKVATFPSSERLALRVPDQRDVDLILDASTDDLIPLITTVEPDCTEVQALEFIERQQGRPGEGQGWSLTVVDRRSDLPVGNLFINCRSLDLRAIELGYWIGPSHRGNGYASEALNVVRDWVPSQFSVDRLSLYIDPENAPSSRTAERAGFRMETTYDRWEKVGDRFRPMDAWSHGPGRPEPAHIGHLEYRMWLNDYRGDARWFDHHLHGDFVEHSCSGVVSARSAIVAVPVTEHIDVDLPLADQQVQQLASDTWMLTYVSHQPRRSCRRVSIWQEFDEGWRLRFHKGTVLP